MTPIFANSEEHLRKLIAQAMAEHGEEADLNHIDVGAISDFSGMFEGSAFNGNISKWDVSQAIHADSMFKNSAFNGDVSRWNVQSLRTTDSMFGGSVFKGDVSQWRFYHITSCEDMFANSAFDGDLSSWPISHVRKMRGMFRRAQFSGDLSDWDFLSRPSYNAMLDPSFTGLLPPLRLLARSVTHTGEYETMMGGGDKLQTYLANQPFNHAHAAFVLEIPGNPMWASPEDRAWLTGFKKTCAAMGLGWDDSVQAMLAAYPLRREAQPEHALTLPELGLG